jgi:cytochrome c2
VPHLPPHRRWRQEPGRADFHRYRRAQGREHEGVCLLDRYEEPGAKGFEWNEDNLRKHLANVKDVVPNRKMVFPGLTDEQDREDLIACLKKLSR